MNSKLAFPSLNGEPEPQIIKHGWPEDKPMPEAIAETIDYVKRTYPDQEIVGEPEIIQTEEHKANGEYLVKVLSL